MLSYRENLAKIGITSEDSVSYKSFYSKPQSLRAAILSMQAPASQDWSQVSDISEDQYWTDEVQGVAWDGANWIFSTNANQKKPDVEDKAIYVFKGGTKLKDGNWMSRLKYKDVPHPISGLKESDHHWGQLVYYNGFVYVSHFWSGGPKPGQTNVVVFKNNNGFLEFHQWIELEMPTSPTDHQQKPAEFQAINPWDGMLYTCFGSGPIYEFFIHDIKSGQYTGITLKFNVPVARVQGACFSQNGHLYIATNEYFSGDSKYQTIWYYSALNGYRLGVIPVLAEEGFPDQELEGICYANVSSSDGKIAQIHAVLLENPGGALDNIFFKSFSSSKPDIV
jgi:hypothetical protein